MLRYRISTNAMMYNGAFKTPKLNSYQSLTNDIRLYTYIEVEHLIVFFEHYIVI